MEMNNRLKAIRQQRQQTAAQIARLLGIQRITYCKYEDNIISMPSIYYVRLASFYKTSIDYLVGLTDDE